MVNLVGERASEVLEILKGISDPEIPVLTIVDLGIVHAIEMHEGNCKVIITPTYTGCPAMRLIEDEIQLALQPFGFNSVKVQLVFSPAWTTDAITEDAKEKLRKYGIAPPKKTIACPQCGSEKAKKISDFGSTACKALYRCEDCKEPFDYFKCI